MPRAIPITGWALSPWHLIQQKYRLKHIVSLDYDWTSSFMVFEIPFLRYTISGDYSTLPLIFLTKSHPQSSVLRHSLTLKIFTTNRGSVAERSPPFPLYFCTCFEAISVTLGRVVTLVYILAHYAHTFIRTFWTGAVRDSPTLSGLLVSLSLRFFPRPLHLFHTSTHTSVSVVCAYILMSTGVLEWQ